MKKEYKTPHMEEVKVNLESHLLDGSITTNGNQTTVQGFDEDEYNGEAASRYYDDWD